MENSDSNFCHLCETCHMDPLFCSSNETPEKEKILPDLSVSYFKTKNKPGRKLLTEKFPQLDCYTNNFISQNLF